MKLIKRYPNRRLYDTEQKSYITLKEVREYIKGYQKFTVVDSKSGDDITRQVLLQVLAEMESEGHASVLTDKFLLEIIRLYDSRISAMAGQWLEQSMVTLLDQQQRWQKELRRFQQFTPTRMLNSFFNGFSDQDDNKK